MNVVAAFINMNKGFAFGDILSPLFVCIIRCASGTTLRNMSFNSGVNATFYYVVV